MSVNSLKRNVYKVVLTGGPCGGKTTGQDRLATFFENLGWKVFRVPETATILLKGGVLFSELDDEEVFSFQEDILRTLISIEDVYFHLAETCKKDCLVICDRGTFDGSAYISSQCWENILGKNHLNAVDLRDNRYNQVVHLVTAAVGAEQFYTLDNNVARSENVEEAKIKDARTREVWVGHPYVDIVDNVGTAKFEDKMLKLIQVVCDRAGVHYGDRLAKNSRKRKFLVEWIESQESFPAYQEFDVVHHYLVSEWHPDQQARIRKRGQGGKWNYTHTVRRRVEGELVETRMQITEREYRALKAHKDFRRYTTYKKRRCFMHGNQYFQLDIYKPPLPPRSPDKTALLMLETYTASTDALDLPECIKISKEVTGDAEYSMYNMSLIEDEDLQNQYRSISERRRTLVNQNFMGLESSSRSSTDLNETMRLKTKGSPTSAFFRFNTPPRPSTDNTLNRQGLNGGSMSIDLDLTREFGIQENGHSSSGEESGIEITNGANGLHLLNGNSLNNGLEMTVGSLPDDVTMADR